MKKILIITYYFPPSGGSGVQRWLKFVKYLPEFGWEPTVITTKDGDYPSIDRSLLEDIPKNIKIIRTKTPTFGNVFHKMNKKNSEIPYGSLESSSEDSLIKKISIWFRLNLVIPDARKIWNKYAFKAAKEELLSHKYDFIVTTGPPHSTHLVGLKLKHKFNIKWIADLRDPWTKMGYLKNVRRWKITERSDQILEQKVIKKCDLLFVAHQKILDDFGNEEKMHLLTNGFDHEDFENIQKEKEQNNFCINYFGTISLEANPISILKAVNELFDKGNKNIRLNFRGKIDHKVKQILQKEDRNDLVKFHSYTSHKKTIKKMINSSLLLLMVNNVPNNKGIIPGKIFEYIGSQIPIVAVGPKEGEVAKILEETNSGKIFTYHEIEDIKKYIESKLDNWKNKKEISKNQNFLKYSRKNLTEKLVSILEN